jgi:uncharacterized protein (TIRG00374 family)
MTRLRLVLLIAGAGVLIWLIARIGPGAVVDALARVTWWQLAVICALHGLALTVDTLGWRYAFARDRVPFWTLLLARTAGEAVNLVSALASVGGEAVKAWLLRDDVPYEESVPSVIVAKTAAVVAQALFLLCGLVIAWTVFSWESSIMTGMLWMLVIEVAAVGGFLATQLSGLIGRAGGLIRAFGLLQADASVTRLDQDLRGYYRSHGARFLSSVAWHSLGCATSVAETWAIMWAIGVPTSALTATVIDSIGSGIRFATFLVPASLGALESGNAAAFAALGLGASAGLVFSLVRRARQAIWIGVGICLLVGMQVRTGQRRRATS